MLEKLPVDGFTWVQNTSKFNKDFIKRNNEDNDEGYFLEADVQYPEELQDLPNDLPFLPEKMKIEKGEQLVANLHDTEEYALRIRHLKKH